MPTLTLSTTQKNKPLLLCKGCTYTIDKTTNNKTYWKCEHAQKFKCKGGVHINYMNTVLLYKNDSHNHSGNAASIEIRLFKEQVRDRATNSNKSTQAVIDNCLVNLSDHAVVRLHDFKHINYLRLIFVRLFFFRSIFAFPYFASESNLVVVKTTTVLVTISASGMCLPPYIIYKSLRLYSQWCPKNIIKGVV